ncbi:MAG: hypothetical protein EA377_14305 [Phycisphaerales bacterium]|nr:MAG: hypothetical protein EA377_14305 [Phycisphaerales bacterium]
MRATGQNEFAEQLPPATVCQWLGNSRLIAAGHPLRATDADWERAVAPVENASRNASWKRAEIEKVEVSPVDANRASTAEIAVSGTEIPM